MNAGVHGTQVRILLISGLLAFVTTRPSASQTQPPTSGNNSIPATLETESYTALPLTLPADNKPNEVRMRFVPRGTGNGLYAPSEGAGLPLNKLRCSDAATERVHQPARPDAPCRQDRDVGTLQFEPKQPALSMPPGTGQLSDILNPTAPRLQLADAARLKLDSEGAFVVFAASGDDMVRTPANYRDPNGRREWIDGRFTLGKRHTLGLTLKDDYDRTLQDSGKPERSSD
jgi:hypothetical protein